MVIGNGDVFTWNDEFTNTSEKFSKIVAPANRRFIFIASGNYHAGAIAIDKYPTWCELKILLVGWLKDESCCFYHKSGVPLFIIQAIIELAWGCELPSMLQCFR